MKQKIAILMCGLLLVANTTSVFAQEYTASTDNAEISLTFNKDSYFTVSLPEAIAGSNEEKSIDFEYSVEGDISANEKITINIEDSDDSVEGIQLELSDTTGITKDATISINKTDFAYDEITSKVTGTGNVTFEGLTAGSWNGVAKFIIDMENIDVDSSEISTAGIYDTDGNMIESWSDMIDDGSVTVEDGVLTAVNISESEYILEIDSSVTSIDEGVFMDNREITGVIIPEGVVSIGDNAFNCCESLTNISIPSTVTSIGENALIGCDLQTITVASANAYYMAEDNVLFDKNQTTLIQYATGSSDTSYVVPEGVTTINDYAFGMAIALTSVTLPDSLVTINDYAFYGCTNLTSIAIPDSVTTIGDSAFSNCKNLASISLGSDDTGSNSELTTIGCQAFANCTSLTGITIPDSVTTINASTVSDSPFYGCNGQTTTNVLKKDSTKLWITVISSDGTLPSGFGTYWNYYSSSKANGYSILSNAEL